MLNNPVDKILDTVAEAEIDLPSGGFWVFISKRPPVKYAPPKMSLHYARPDIDEKHASKIQSKIDDGWAEESSNGAIFDYHYGGYTHDWRKAVKIDYMGESIRLFPDEYSRVTHESMVLYTLSPEVEVTDPDTGEITHTTTHELVVTRQVDKALLRTALDTSLKTVFDCALIEGCTPVQAFLLILGANVTDFDFEFPPVGYYRMRGFIAPTFMDWRDYQEFIKEEIVI